MPVVSCTRTGPEAAVGPLLQRSPLQDPLLGDWGKSKARTLSLFGVIVMLISLEKMYKAAHQVFHFHCFLKQSAEAPWGPGIQLFPGLSTPGEANSHWKAAQPTHRCWSPLVFLSERKRGQVSAAKSSDCWVSQGEGL